MNQNCKIFLKKQRKITLSKNKNNKHMGILLDQIKVYASNIVVPGNDSGSTDKKDSA